MEQFFLKIYRSTLAKNKLQRAISEMAYQYECVLTTDIENTLEVMRQSHQELVANNAKSKTEEFRVLAYDDNCKHILLAENVSIEARRVRNTLN